VGALETPHSAPLPNGQGSQRGGMGGGGMSGNRSNNGQNNLANDRFNGDNAEQKVWLKVHWETSPPVRF